jgi:predicted aspartyl protease
MSSQSERATKDQKRYCALVSPFGFATSNSTCRQNQIAISPLIDTAALDNQMGKDAVTDFGLGVTDFVPSDSGGGAAGFSSGSAAFTDPGGSNKSNTIPLGRFGAVGGDMGGNAIAIYNDKGTMFHSWADAKPFTLGSMQSDHLQFVVTDFPKPGSGGILSADLFHKYDMDLNFMAHKLNMFAPDHCEGWVLYWRAPGVAELPFGYQNGKIAVRVSVNGRSMDAVIDTGSPHTMMQISDADRLFDITTSSPGVTPTDNNLYAYTFKTLSFGEVAIGNPRLFLTRATLERGVISAPQTGTMLRATNRQPTLVIGTDLLKLLHLYISFKEGMVYVTQGPELPEGDVKALPVVTVTPFRP